jgi:hypothetical protein
MSEIEIHLDLRVSSLPAPRRYEVRSHLELVSIWRPDSPEAVEYFGIVDPWRCAWDVMFMAR